MAIRNLMPLYVIKLPNRLWKALRDQRVFDDAPAEARKLFHTARGRPFVQSDCRFIVGTARDITLVLDHMKTLMWRIENRQGVTASQFGYGRAILRTHTHQRMRQINDTPLRRDPAPRPHDKGEHVVQ